MEDEGSMTIKLHPLVLLNISQHFTRIRAQKNHTQNNLTPPIVGGALLGKLTARTTDIREVFEVPLNTDNEQAVLDINYMTEKAEHLTQVTDLEVVGWYSTGSLLPREADHAITRQMNERKEATLMLKVDPFKSDRGTNDLPASLFELEPNGELVQRAFIIESLESERVVVEGLANDYSGSSHEYGSLMRLYMKVNILEKYLASVESGELPPNPDLLRQVKCIVQKLPTAPESSLNETSVEATAIESLASITGGSQQLQQLLQKLEIIQDKKQGGPRLRHLLI